MNDTFLISYFPNSQARTTERMSCGIFVNVESLCISKMILLFKLLIPSSFLLYYFKTRKTKK